MKVLILGGGGTLGAFSAGALRALEQRGFVPDAMIGSSAGGINMLRWLVGGAEEAIRFWKDTASPRMLGRRRSTAASRPGRRTVREPTRWSYCSYTRRFDAIDGERRSSSSASCGESETRTPIGGGARRGRASIR